LISHRSTSHPKVSAYSSAGVSARNACTFASGYAFRAFSFNVCSIIGVLSTHIMVTDLPPVQIQLFFYTFYLKGRYKCVTGKKSGRNTLPLFFIINNVQK
jgi:hypothetical protein